MNRKLFLISLFFGVLFFSVPFNANAQKTDKTAGNNKVPAVNKTPTPEPSGKNKITITSTSELENQIIDEINFVRTKPVEYAKMLEEMRNYYKGMAFTVPGQKTLITLEGTVSLNETINELKTLQPREPVETNCSAVRASRDQLADLQSSGAFSHFGNDGSSPQERLKKYLRGEFYSSESIASRRGSARNIVMQFLLDDGLPERPHRQNLLNPSFKFAGIATGDNLKKKTLTVIVLSDSSAEIEPCEMK